MDVLIDDLLKEVEGALQSPSRANEQTVPPFRSVVRAIVVLLIVVLVAAVIVVILISNEASSHTTSSNNNR